MSQRKLFQHGLAHTPYYIVHILYYIRGRAMQRTVSSTPLNTLYIYLFNLFSAIQKCPFENKTLNNHHNKVAFTDLYYNILLPLQQLFD